MKGSKNIFILLFLGSVSAFPRILSPVSKYARPSIVGGGVVRNNELPYQLSLQINGNHSCGASIINEDYALTAAHCVHNVQASQFTIVAGEHALDTDEGTEQVRKISQVIIHEGYKSFYFFNDIALLKFASPLVLDDFVKFINLPQPDFNATGVAVVSGWGHETNGGINSNLLRKVSVPIISDEECIQAYNDEEVLSTMICAGFPQGGKDSCQNDSGGPLVVNNGDYPLLVGVVSWGYKCAQPNYPGVYTEVSKYIPWINGYIH